MTRSAEAIGLLFSRRRIADRTKWLAAMGLFLAVGCGGTKQLSSEELRDPQACQSCHPAQYADWSGSMHAYAADDPVFLAMNKRGQRETNGQLGDFCVKCHAPLAVKEGKTTDGLNLDAVPRNLKGVTCFFCHTAKSVDGAHNNALTLGDDETLRGEYRDPIAATPHKSTYSTLHDRDQLDSASMCGSCHDLVTPKSLALERTFSEWQGSVFSHAPGGTTCGQCHMTRSTGPIATTKGSPDRELHSHSFAAVDTALTDFPDRQRQSSEVQTLLDSTLQSALCVKTLGGKAELEVILDNVGAGHSWPSGSAQDRRAWVEVVASSGGSTVYQSAAPSDPDFWLLRDCIFDEAKRPVAMFWEAALHDDNLLPAQTTFDPSDPDFYRTHVYRKFPATGAFPIAAPDKVTLKIKLQPIGKDVLDDLVASGDLSQEHANAMPTWTINGTLEWTKATATETFFDPASGATVSCVSATNLSGKADKVLARTLSTCALP